MKIKKNNIFLWLVRSTFGISHDCKCPESFCAFFVMLIASIVVAPLLILSHLCNFVFGKFNKDYHFQCNWFVGLCLLLMSWIIGNELILKFDLIKRSIGWHRIIYFSEATGLGFFIFTAIGVSVVFTGVGLAKWFSRLSDKEHRRNMETLDRALRRPYKQKEIKEKKRWFITVFIKSNKEKYCPRIEYVDSEL